MNYTEVFDQYSDQGWDDSTKLALIMDFLDRHEDTVVTPTMFNDYLMSNAVE